ncbi:MAG: glycosyltransferase family 2 protein [Microgenomates group bacterium]
MLTVVILTKNNQDQNFENCLRSVNFADEIIIVNDGSASENFINHLTKNKNVKIYERALNGDFANQRNFGLSKAQGDWILFIDSDEQITEELKKEIVNIIQLKNTDIVAYYIKRRDLFWSREVRFGEIAKTRNKGIIRLVRKGVGQWKGKIHEEFKINNNSFKTSTLKNFINHYPHQSLKEFIEEINFYSTIRANELYLKNKKTNVFEIIFYPFFKFILTYFICLGFLDGAAGFVYSFMMSFHSFLVRAKLYLKNNNN